MLTWREYLVALWYWPLMQLEIALVLTGGGYLVGLGLGLWEDELGNASMLGLIVFISGMVCIFDSSKLLARRHQHYRRLVAFMQRHGVPPELEERYRVLPCQLRLITWAARTAGKEHELRQVRKRK